VKNELEIKLQATCFIWSWNNYPHLRGLFWRVKNEERYCPGESRGAFQARLARNLGTGILPGVADTHLFFDGTLFLFEYKVHPNVQQQAQLDWQAKMEDAGAHYFLIYSLAEHQRVWKEITTLE
jgi:hypothetical protein